MTSLTIETLTLPAAAIGPDSPLPPLAPPVDVHASVERVPDIPEEDQKYIGYGNAPGCLPYLMQDGYGRALEPTGFKVAVLENETLRATFMLELGGRLWSLVHKPIGDELLQSNPVVQPGNLAIRSAWLSGGVEWNVGLAGHCPFTCSPAFAARTHMPDGTPVLRLYEWERIRQVPFQLDAWLPAGSPVLLVRVRLVNPHDREIPMYWWSNIAAQQHPRTRVIVPADHAYRHGYPAIARVNIPMLDGQDVSYPSDHKQAMDYFYRLPDGQRPWITAVDERGTGLVQTSTDLLKGRKLFLWGTGPGGQRWQRFLSQPGQAYIEIQAGLARTQMEHLPMPAGACWQWLEAYGRMAVDPAIAHGRDWQQAQAAVERRLDELVTRDALQGDLDRSSAMADQPPDQIIHRGSGWGALERRRREKAGEPMFCSQALVFDDDSLTDAQRPWVALLEHGTLPEPAPGSPPAAPMVQSPWRATLEDAVKGPDAQSWHAWLQLGVMRYHAGEQDGAEQAWQKSLAIERTAWALRNLAVLARERKELDRAADLIVQALGLQPNLKGLAIECGHMLVKAGRAGQWLELFAGLPACLREQGRLRLLEAGAALEVGRFDVVDHLIERAPQIPDLREGEASLSDLWFQLHEKRVSAAENVPVDDALRDRVRREFPPPQAIDFRTWG